MSSAATPHSVTLLRWCSIPLVWVCFLSRELALKQQLKMYLLHKCMLKTRLLPKGRRCPNLHTTTTIAILGFRSHSRRWWCQTTTSQAVWLFVGDCRYIILSTGFQPRSRAHSGGSTGDFLLQTYVGLKLAWTFDLVFTPSNYTNTQPNNMIPSVWSLRRGSCHDD